MTDYFPTYRELRTVKLYNLDDAACLDIIWQKRFGGLTVCPRCGRGAKFYPITGRKSYTTGICRHSISPLAGTIFNKSTTPLHVWFLAIYDLLTSDGKMPAKELQRRYEVTYKTAWRMKHAITRYLGITYPPNRGFSYQYSSRQNGRYSQADYIAKHNL